MGYNGGCQDKVHGHCSRWIITQVTCLLAVKLHVALEFAFLFSWPLTGMYKVLEMTSRGTVGFNFNMRKPSHINSRMQGLSGDVVPKSVIPKSG